ncbi:MAG: T9SS type A sorting domain-containing protein, partial [Bacteroidota bacterium]
IVQVTCGTNTALSTIHTETSNNPNFNEVVIARNFNNITVSSTGQQGYFAANALNNCYRVTMTVGNVCGESSITAFLDFNTQFRLANPNQPMAVDPRVASMAVKLWPNPATHHALIEYELPVEGLVRLDLLDANGRLVATPLETFQPAGGHRGKLDLSQLPAGVYQWRMVAGNERKQGRMIKQ